MKKLKTFLVWLIFGYDNRPIRTHLKYCNSNLNVLGVLRENKDISDFKLSAPHGYFISPNDYSFKESETFNVLDIKGEIFLKPSNDTKIFYKIIFMFPLIFGFVLDKFGLFWAVESFIIINFGTLILQFKNHQILRLKLDEITDHRNFSKYFDLLRLELAIERLYNFKNRTLNENEKYIQNQDIYLVKHLIRDEKFQLSDYSKYILDLEILIIEHVIDQTKYGEIMNLIEDDLTYHNNNFGDKSFRLLTKKVSESLSKEVYFWKIKE
jgi:hypothetical protein